MRTQFHHRAWLPEQNVAGSGTFGAQDRHFDQVRLDG